MSGTVRAVLFALGGVLALAGGAAWLVVDEPGHARAGAALGAGALGLSLGLASWVRHRYPVAAAVEERHSWSPPCIGCRSDPKMTRRRLLLGGGAAAAGAAGVGALLRFDDEAQRALRSTAWEPGSRLMTADGRPVRVGDLDVGATVTVWPEQAIGAADSQVVLVRLEPERIVVRDPLRVDWAPDGHLAYSRLCTHMACPVGLYQQDPDVLICPCHQAVFDVFDGGRALHGPARRSLPQLPLQADADGTLRARSDFTEPVGGTWWDRDR
jgi:ubiquinol-cytochrome c reductase iron-sulfur subunit